MIFNTLYNISAFILSAYVITDIIKKIRRMYMNDYNKLKDENKRLEQENFELKKNNTDDSGENKRNKAMKEEFAANNNIRNHRQLTDRELMEQIYQLLVGVNAKLDKLGILKYKELGVDVSIFTLPFSDDTLDDKQSKTESLEQTLDDTQKYFDEIFKPIED